MKLTAIYEEDKQCGGFTCWIEQIPEVISQGETLEEAKANLIDALKLVLEYRREESESELKKLKAQKIHVTRENLNFA